MNVGLVVDASVAIAWVVRSQSNEEEVMTLLDQVSAGSPMVIPVLWVFEVANTLAILLRRRIVNEEQYGEACERLAELPSLRDDEGQQLAFTEISKLARNYSLSVYDAVYLELALRRGLPLASRDAALNKAAKRAGVKALLR